MFVGYFNEISPPFNVFQLDGVESGTLIFEACEETHFTLVLEGDERLISKEDFKWCGEDFNPECCC